MNLAAARWLIEEHGSVLVGSDTSMLEVFPAVDGDSWHPVHEYLLVDHGVHIAELHYLEDLASDRRYEFCYVALLPKHIVRLNSRPEASNGPEQAFERRSSLPSGCVAD